MLEFGEKLTLTPSAMTEQDVEGLRASGFSDRDILSIILAAAYRNFIVRVADALGAAPVSAAASTYDLLAELDTEDAVRRLTPDFAALKPFSERGVIVTAEGAGEYDFVSRFFAPSQRIDEDPVTGSAHCVLGPYWGARLARTTMTAYQASARGGIVRVEVAGARVRLGGKAVTVMRGELL